MQTLAFKALFRKKGTASAILAIALLVALVTSVNCLVNNINSQTTAITKLARTGETYLITSKDATVLTDSHIDVAIFTQVKNATDVGYAVSQQIIQATLLTDNGSYTVNLRGVDDLRAFLNHRGGWINGLVSKEPSEVNVGTVLAKLASVNKGNMLNLTVNGEAVAVKVAGITQAKDQSDTEIILPLVTLQNFTHTSGTVSYIEFSIKTPAEANTTINNLTQTLPAEVQITSTQQVAAFAQDINNQTVVFINVWSLAIYCVVVAASYIVASRLVNEAGYELYMLRTLGTKKKATANLILIYTLTIAFVGAVLGLSIGIVGTQTASTAVRWFLGNSMLAPYLEVSQLLGILLIATAASLIGSIYPAVKAAQNAVRENPS